MKTNVILIPAIAGVVALAVVGCGDDSPTLVATGGTTGTATGTPTGGVGATGPTGGAGAVGATGAVGPTGGGGAVAAGDFLDGYLQNGTWSGYCFTAAEALTAGATVASSITPVCTEDTACFVGNQVCASGTVTQDTAYAQWAMIGCNLNQDAATSEQGTWAVSGTGVRVSVTNTAGATLRLQCQDAEGDTPGEAGDTHRWCATLQKDQPTQDIPWSSIVTQCWEGGTQVPVPAGTLLTQCAITVPGTNNKDIPFDYCVTGLTVY